MCTLLSAERTTRSLAALAILAANVATAGFGSNFTDGIEIAFQ